MRPSQYDTPLPSCRKPSALLGTDAGGAADQGAIAGAWDAILSILSISGVREPLD